MNAISFWGDFVVRNADGLSIGESVDEIIKCSEYNIINFEAPIETKYTPIIKAGPNNSQSKDAPLWALNHGFNVFGLANNHSLDFGENALRETIECFPTGSTIGAGNWSEAYSPRILKLENGKVIGIITGTHNEFGTLTDFYTQANSLGTAWLFHPLLTELIIETRKKVDFLYIYAHGGVEFLEQPLPEWRDQFKHFINIGCDGVVCSHPHIPMGWEYYQGKPIVYSLGNFCFQKPSLKSTQLRYNWNNSLCCSIDFCHDNPKIEIIPINYDVDCNAINICKSDEYIKYLSNVNQVLKDEVLYIEKINRDVKALYPMYQRMLGVSTYKKGYMAKFKTIVTKYLRNHKNSSVVSTLNALQCESHRWCILRSIDNSLKHE